MSNKAIYYKQLDNGNAAHVYEHIIANAVTAEFLKRNLFRNFDYEFYARQTDGIVRLAVYALNKKYLKIFSEVISNFGYKQKDLEDAISQVANEYKKTITYDTEELVGILDAAQKTSWIESNKMGMTDFPTESARVYKTKAISIEKSNKSNYRTYELVYEITKLPDHLRPLAVYVLISIGINVIDIAYVKYKDVYDDGDMWLEYSEEMGYLNFLSVPAAGKYKKSDFMDIQKGLIETFSQKDICNRIAKYAANDFSKIDSFFTDSEMYSRSGHYIGAEEFKKHTTAENVAEILKNIKLDVVTKR